MLVASSIVNATHNIQPVAIATYKDVDLLDKKDEASAVGVQFDGEGIIYGLENVLYRILKSYSSALRSRAESTAVCRFYGRGGGYSADRPLGRRMDQVQHYSLVRWRFQGYFGCA